MERKIADCINIRVNVGNYQHIELVKYSEETISYESDNERIEKEKKLSSDLLLSITETLKMIPEKLGKGANEIQKVEESIKSKIPDWLENGPVPNIANNAEKKFNQVKSEQQEIKEKDNTILDVEDSVSKSTKNNDDLFEEVTTNADDLFEE